MSSLRREHPSTMAAPLRGAGFPPVAESKTMMRFSADRLTVTIEKALHYIVKEVLDGRGKMAFDSAESRYYFYLPVEPSDVVRHNYLRNFAEVWLWTRSDMDVR